MKLERAPLGGEEQRQLVGCRASSTNPLGQCRTPRAHEREEEQSGRFCYEPKLDPSLGWNRRGVGPPPRLLGVTSSRHEGYNDQYHKQRDSKGVHDGGCAQAKDGDHRTSNHSRHAECRVGDRED